MKREVAFFRDRRARSGRALVETMRALGMTDDEIRAALTAPDQPPAPAAAPHAGEPLSSGSAELEHGAPANPAQSGQGAVA